MLTYVRALRLPSWQAVRRSLALSEQHRRFLVRAVLLALGVRVGLLLAAYVTGYIIAGMENASVPRVIGEMFNRWDATNYERIAEVGYKSEGHDRLFIVFFPLYPLLIRIAYYVLYPFQSYFVAALFVSALASVAAGFFLQVLVAGDGGDDAEAERSAWYMSLFPTAYFLAMPYTEALFLALAVASFVAARRRRWAWSGTLGLLACATRAQGIALAPALAVEALHRERWAAPQRAFWLALVPVGLLAYLGINWTVFGDPLEFMTIQREHWYHEFIWPWEGIRDTFTGIQEMQPGSYRVSILEFRAAAMVLTAGLLLGGATWLRPSYQVYGWLSLLFLVSVSFQISLPRYVLGIFPIFQVLAKVGGSPNVHQAALTISAVLFGVFYVLYATNWGF